uniref:DUF494 family protein n=1 Tax=Eiseniibacteriota bacterium TaxID=2212470 RepID=A0A832HZN3_UNCEI
MSAPRGTPAVHDVLRLIAEHLDAWLEGDEAALEALAEALAAGDLGVEDLQAAADVLRHLAAGAAAGGADPALDAAPANGALRVPSAEERASLSPEAWGALLALRRDGSLDAAQFERVLGVLGGIGVRPVDAGLALEVAGRVVLDADENGMEAGHGEIDLPH